ncbi:MAG TPA: type III pantothenate kinase [Dokdonella sp.]
MNLLIDFGNTRLKWARLDGGRLQPGGAFVHAGRALGPLLGREWSGLGAVDAVLVASVVAAARERELGDDVRGRFGVRAEFVRSPAAALGVRNAYAEPERLGVDRFLALVALHADAPRALVHVGVGTALTLDALAADGAHLGGLILPGPRLMREAVLGGTARVGAVDGQWSEMPQSTADAVFSGALCAASGAIDRFRVAAERRLGAPPALLVSGGGADELVPLVAGAERRHDLVLHGLARWAADPPAHAG